MEAGRREGGVRGGAAPAAAAGLQGLAVHKPGEGHNQRLALRHTTADLSPPETGAGDMSQVTGNMSQVTGDMSQVTGGKRHLSCAGSRVTGGRAPSPAGSDP